MMIFCGKALYYKDNSILLREVELVATVQTKVVSQKG